MSTTPIEQQSTTPEDPAPKEGEENPPTDENPGEQTDPPVEEEPTLSLEDALSEVTKTRGEAANYRIRAKAAEDALKTAKTLEEVNAIVQRMSEERESSERTLLAENVALKYALPEALASRLQGATREELEADAQSLATLIPATKTEAPVIRLKGGLNPDEGPDPDANLTPGELARKHAPRRR